MTEQTEQASAPAAPTPTPPMYRDNKREALRAMASYEKTKDPDALAAAQVYATLYAGDMSEKLVITGARIQWAIEGAGR